MKHTIKSNDSGQALVEYAIMASISVIVLIAVFEIFCSALGFYSLANLSIAALPVP